MYIIHIYKTLMALFPKLKVIKSIISRNDGSFSRCLLGFIDIRQDSDLGIDYSSIRHDITNP